MNLLQLEESKLREIIKDFINSNSSHSAITVNDFEYTYKHLTLKDLNKITHSSGAIYYCYGSYDTDKKFLLGDFQHIVKYNELNWFRLFSMYYTKNYIPYFEQFYSYNNTSSDTYVNHFNNVFVKYIQLQLQNNSISSPNSPFVFTGIEITLK